MKFGAENVRRMIPRMKAVAQEHGINMEYGGTVGNTFDSHRLIWKAREMGGADLQDKMVEYLFRAYFEDNESLGDNDVLVRCATNAGLENSLDFLSNPESGCEEVRSEMQEYGRAFNCTGVPMFIVDEKFVLNGAQEPNAFLRTFSKLE